MARSAQNRLDNASRLDVDDDGGMEPEKVAAIRRGDRARTAAYRKGRNAGTASVKDRRAGVLRPKAVPEVYDPDDSPDEHAAYHQGADEAIAEQRRRAASGLVDQAKSSRAGTSIDEGAGFLLGLIGYALVLAYLRGGPAGVKGWLAAKFLNKPAGAAKPSPSSPSSPSSPTMPVPTRNPVLA